MLIRRRNLLKITVGFAAALLSGYAFSASSPKPQRPDIVVILADDVGYSDLGCYGGEIQTPNIDRLAANGLRFAQFYNSARCCPSRASLLTGLYPHQAGMGHMTEDKGLPAYSGSLGKNAVTLAEALKLGGYQTFMCGKWHLAKSPFTKDDFESWPNQRGFDRFYGTLPSDGSQWDPAGLVEDNEFVKPAKDFFYTDAIAQKAAQYIKQASAKESPFFMYVAFTAAHYPLHARKATIDKYQGVFDDGWDAVRKRRFENMKKLGIIPADLAMQEHDPGAKQWQTETHKEWQAQRMQTYAAMVDEMDQGIGHIIKALQESGRFENTLLVFLSDNGGSPEGHLNNTVERTGDPWASPLIPKLAPDGKPVVAGDIPGLPLGGADTYGSYGLEWAGASNTPFRRHKIWVHEGGISTPFIVHWPRKIKERGALRNHVAHIIDLMPTFIKASGVKYPARFKGFDIPMPAGRSLLAAIKGKEDTERVLCWEHEGNRAVRKGKWKLVSEYSGQWENFIPASPAAGSSMTFRPTGAS